MKDITAQRFNRLVAQWPVGRNKHGQTFWLCLCDCGELTTAHTGNLASGQVRSCGCLKVEKSAETGRRTIKIAQPLGTAAAALVHTTHGYAGGGGSREYQTWQTMLQRCTNPVNTNYPRYGGKGIAVCDRWLDFQTFLADLGERPEGTTLGRFLDMGNYEPGNCQWMTDAEQKAEAKKKRDVLGIRHKIRRDAGKPRKAA